MKLLLLLLINGLVFANQKITRAEEITYEWLIEAGNLSGYTEHVRHFEKLFQHFKARTFLEFGVGFSTKYFLDKCPKVISVEFITNGYGPEWFKECLKLYQNFYHWVPIAFFSRYPGDTSWAPYKYAGTDSVYNAGSYQCSNHKNYALIDDFYLKELDAFISNLVKCHPINIAFVDAGIYLRGDFVQLMFGKVPVIAAHDTACRAAKMPDDVYGYSRVVTPSQYEEIFIPKGMGTTFWILKEEKYTQLIQAMKEYAQSD